MLIKLRKMMTNQKGFTLVELMVVIAIIGVLATIAIPKISASNAVAKDAKLLADLRTIDSAIMLYYANHGSTYPATGVAALETALVTTDKVLVAMPKSSDGTTALTYTIVTGGYTLSGKKTDGSTLNSPASTVVVAAAE